MSLNPLDRISLFLFFRSKKLGDPVTLFWLIFAISLGLLYPVLALLKISGETYWIEDDARQHVFWMVRFLDPALLPDDLIANYYQSISPIGISFLYYCLAKLNIDPVHASRFFPLILSPLTAFICFFICLEILPIPFAGFISSTVLLQNLWLQDGLNSATSRAFFIPAFLLFIWAMLRNSGLWMSLSIILIGLFYAPYLLIVAGILVCQCFTIDHWKIQLNRNRQDRILAICGLLISFIMLFPHVVVGSEFEPVITLAQAKQLPEFEAGGRASFFETNWWDYLFNGSRSGIRITSALMPDVAYVALFLPLIFYYERYFPLVDNVRKIYFFNQLVLSAFTLFILAHLLLFKLYLPSRYTLHSLRFTVTILSGITLVFLLDKLFAQCKKIKSNFVQLIPVGFILSIITLSLLVLPLTEDDFPNTGYVIGNYGNLYQFLSRTPKNTLIASLTDETSNIPSFSQRSVFVANEYGIPYHLGYYEKFRRRVESLIAAHYTTNLKGLQLFIKESGVDLWLINANVFSSQSLQENRWFNHFQPEASNAIRQVKLDQGEIALWQAHKQCTIFTDQDIDVVSSDCILSLTSSKSS